MKTHMLKIVPAYFEPVNDGRKTFEVRSIEDRDFGVGDTLWLREWKDGDYTGRSCRRTITFILAGAPQFVPQGYAILGLYPERMTKLCDAALAVIAKWDSPAWKDLPHTGALINDLRDALFPRIDEQPGEPHAK